MHLLILCAAFWTAIALFVRSHAPGRRSDDLRFVAGLALGTAFAHLGWALLNLHAVRDHPEAWLNPAVGYSVLFVPTGVLLLDPWSSAMKSLPLALAVARTGCLVSGCCNGVNSAWIPWGFHPTPVYDIGLLVALHFAIWRVRDDLVIPAFLVGFGSIRLALEPLRAPAPLGDPWISPLWIAAIWVVVGVGIAAILTRASTAENLSPAGTESA
jgi:hypothetical protein